MNIQQILVDAVALLKQHQVNVPELTARVLLADVLKKDTSWLIAHFTDIIEPSLVKAYFELLQKRCSRVPTQYVRGVQEFYGLSFQVIPDVLIPRPETELLVETALERIQPKDKIVDVGTGSGAIAVAVAKHAPESQVLAFDISAEAVKVAKGNAEKLGVKVQFGIGDLTNALSSGMMDIVLSNPPYVPQSDAEFLQQEIRFEPSLALFGGPDGLEVIRRLIPGSARILKPGGWLLFEIGSDSSSAVEGLLKNDTWEQPSILCDLAGLDRVVTVRRKH